MGKPVVDRNLFDHPEHFDDEIRAYRTSKRYIPTALESMLFELSGHKCTICSAPWLEIHHINELSEGGKTEYENLIVLCPNCHTRVHADGIPTKEELRHYKLKQEIAYELPIISRLTECERDFISKVANLDEARQIVFSDRFSTEVSEEDQCRAVESARLGFGLLHLQEYGIIDVALELAIGLADGKRTAVALRAKLTGKGIRWIRYLKESNRVPM